LQALQLDLKTLFALIINNKIKTSTLITSQQKFKYLFNKGHYEISGLPSASILRARILNNLEIKVYRFGKALNQKWTDIKRKEKLRK
jgi:hypothetical protein